MKNAIEKIKDLTFGVEIECEGINQNNAVVCLEGILGGRGIYVGRHLSNWEVSMPDGRKWEIVTDGSLYGGCEVVTPIMKYKDIETVQAVLRGLRRIGAKWNERTGLHIHVGAKDMTATQLANLAKIFYRQERLILKAAGTQEARIEWYTRPTDVGFMHRVEAIHNPTMEDLNKAWFERYTPCPGHYDRHRYRALNYNNILTLTGSTKPTVEFRFFEGTGHAGILRANILLALTMVAFAKEAKAASSNHQRTYSESSAKYDFRGFMLRLGWIGEEFKNPRKHLLANLPGSAAFKNGRR